jgi:hypothetical protein
MPGMPGPGGPYGMRPGMMMPGGEGHSTADLCISIPSESMQGPIRTVCGDAHMQLVVCS